MGRTNLVDCSFVCLTKRWPVGGSEAALSQSIQSVSSLLRPEKQKKLSKNVFYQHLQRSLSPPPAHFHLKSPIAAQHYNSFCGLFTMTDTFQTHKNYFNTVAEAAGCWIVYRSGGYKSAYSQASQSYTGKCRAAGEVGGLRLGLPSLPLCLPGNEALSLFTRILSGCAPKLSNFALSCVQ